MSFHVSFQQTGGTPGEIGTYPTMADAIAAAHDAGAIIDLGIPYGVSEHDLSFEVRGYEGNDCHAIWIERARSSQD